jgi:hypothetical protein
MTTAGDVVNKVHSRLLSGVRQQIVTLSAAYTAGSSVMQVSGAYTGAIVDGTVLSVDLELFYVSAASGSGTLTLTVIPGFNGSTEANHASGAQAVINDRFPAFDILQAINDDLLDLSAPYNGLGQILFIDQTFNPTYQGYDLGSQFDSVSSKILEISYQIAPPVRTYPLIRRGRYQVRRNANQPSVFPSGNGLIIYDSGYPGLPLHIQFLAPYSPLVNLTDDLTAVAGLPASQYDLPALGAEILLIQPREVKRNFIEAQPDPRKAPEVPPGATMNSLQQLQAQRMRRIDAEADRISRAYPEAESF